MCGKKLTIIPGATHLFEEPGTLEQVAEQASGWFLQYLGEPELSAILATNFDPKIQETLYKIAGNITGMEQYMEMMQQMQQMQ